VEVLETDDLEAVKCQCLTELSNTCHEPTAIKKGVDSFSLKREDASSKRDGFVDSQ